jgi:selenocysteine-specific elongation factor
MRHVILGTAGHIDHGKSVLVKALTGTDPDRLKEEKERGITIDLGFAELEYPDGLSIGIVDVPGHERLVRNMLAGAGGIDMVLLVIAADEGIMPQSREHLHICNLLRIKTGIVAITKADLVEADWLDLVREEVGEFVRGTFLEGADIVDVSSKTGHNLDLLKEKIRAVALGTEQKPGKGLFRLPVDRVFTLKGFGTVVTGTVVSGSVSGEGSVELLPRGEVLKVRGLHTHGRAVGEVHAGQRSAINLQGVEKDELSRGDTLVSPGRLSPSTSLDAAVHLLPKAPVLKSRALVHFHLGTSETIARVILYGTEQLKPGESCYCQFRLMGPIVAQAGDRYIIRRFSPVDTVGGGEVLDPSPSRRRKKDGTDDLEVFENGTLKEKLGVKIRKAGLNGMTAASLEGWTSAETPEIGKSVAMLVSEGAVMKIDDIILHKDSFEDFRKGITGRLEEFHVKNPLKRGMPKEEIRVRMMVSPRVFGSLVSLVPEVMVEKDLLRLESFRTSLSEEHKERVLKTLEQKGFSPPSRQDLAEALKLKDKQVADMLELMGREGLVTRISDSVYLGRGTFEKMISLLKSHFEAKGDMTVSEFRDMLGTTRKYALPFLEYLDSNAITMRVGDVRKLLLK